MAAKDSWGHLTDYTLGKMTALSLAVQALARTLSGSDRERYLKSIDVYIQSMEKNTDLKKKYPEMWEEHLKELRRLRVE